MKLFYKILGTAIAVVLWLLANGLLGKPLPATDATIASCALATAGIVICAMRVMQTEDEE